MLLISTPSWVPSHSPAMLLAPFLSPRAPTHVHCYHPPSCSSWYTLYSSFPLIWFDLGTIIHYHHYFVSQVPCLHGYLCQLMAANHAVLYSYVQFILSIPLLSKSFLSISFNVFFVLPTDILPSPSECLTHIFITAGKPQLCPPTPPFTLLKKPVPFKNATHVPLQLTPGKALQRLVKWSV